MARESQGGNHNWIRLQFRKKVWIRTGEEIRLSVSRPRPCPLVDRGQQNVKGCQSVDRSVNLSPATVDRVVDRAAPMHVVHAGQPSGRSGHVLVHAADCLFAHSGFRSQHYLYHW